MIKIEVFGPGCYRCYAAKEAIRRAVEGLGVEASLIHVHDPREMARNRVFFTPAVCIDGEMKCSGRVPSPDEVTKWLINRMAELNEPGGKHGIVEPPRPSSEPGSVRS